MSPEDDLSALSYEQARDELLEVVRRLEGGGTTLEDSLALWERGEDWLDGARARIEAAKAADPQAASPSEDKAAAKRSSSA